MTRGCEYGENMALITFCLLGCGRTHSSEHCFAPSCGVDTTLSSVT